MADDGYEARLCAALMQIFGKGDHGLAAVAQGLNATDLRPAGAASWSADLFCAELRRLAQPPDKQPSLRIREADEGKGDPAPYPRRAQSLEERAEFLLKYGLRNQWYCIAASGDVGAKPVGLKRLGERLVLWRDARGEVHALEDRCPHRGVALSIGEVRDGLLTCAYHGIQIDEGGRVVKVPALSNCPLEGQKLVRTFPVIEHYQAIWAYFGDEKHRAPPPLELPEELVSSEWSGLLHVDTWNAHYQYVYDNLCDPMHAPYLHGQSYTLSYGPLNDRIKVNRKEHGFEVFREGQRGVNFDWMEFVDAGSSYFVRVEIPYPPSAGPGGAMGIVFYVTPIDESHSWVSVWRLRKVQGWQRDLWDFMFREKLRSFADAVLAQDRAALDAMPPWPASENLYQHDIGLTRLRKIIKDAAQSQAREFALADAEPTRF